MLKSRVAWTWSLTDDNLSYLCLGVTSLVVQFRQLNSRILKRGFQLPTQLPKIKGLKSNINLSSCLYWYATLNSCKYLKKKTLVFEMLNLIEAFPLVKGLRKLWLMTCKEKLVVNCRCWLLFALLRFALLCFILRRFKF